MASLSVFAPDSTGRTSAPSARMRSTFGCWRATSIAPMNTTHSQAELGAHRRGGDAVHAGAGLGDDARLAHALGQHDLAEHVVHLVRAGVIEVLALEIDFRAAEMLRSAARRNKAATAGRRSSSDGRPSRA